MESKKFIPVGQVFDFGLVKLQCLEKKSFPDCNGCIFFDFCDDYLTDFIGCCSSFYRPDGKDVIFVEYKDENN